MRNNLRTTFFFSLILFFTISTNEADAASGFLSKRKYANQAEIDLGAKKYSYPQTELNNLDGDTMPYGLCGNLRYRYYIWDFFAIGPTLEYCQANYKGGDTASIKSAKTTTFGGTLDVIFSVPLKQRVIGGPFAGQALELGFGLGLGYFSANFNRDYSDDTKPFSAKAAGLAATVMTYADFGTDQWGVRINLTLQKFQLPSISPDHPKMSTTIDKEAVSSSQDALKVDAGVRVAF